MSDTFRHHTLLPISGINNLLQANPISLITRTEVIFLCVSLSPYTVSSQPEARVSDSFTLASHLSMLSASFQRALGSSPWSKSLYRSGPRCLLFLVTGLPLAGSAPMALGSSLCQAPSIHAKSSLASDTQIASYWELQSHDLLFLSPALPFCKPFLFAWVQHIDTKQE